MIPEEPPKAGLAARAVALLIDAALLGLLQEWPGKGYWVGLLFILSRDAFMVGRSPGKRLLGLHVVRIDNGACRPAGIRESILRNAPLALGYLIAAFPLVGWLLGAAVWGIEGLLVMGSEKGTRLGDELAGTLVAVEEDTNVSK